MAKASKTPEFTMKPDESKVLLQETFQTVEELQGLLGQSIRISNQHPSTIYVSVPVSSDFVGLDTQFTLEAHGLSDGSVVYNITIE